ncbi:gastrula zinc finger protein XlCGF57.1-like [Nematolebias whitei]|uniref:gastrula zinc finger protein XlCGF57.1-like n=1 Tax=Nematolebias whitei TaxID=451745 RepID=UPI001898515B|nr:gastrula zinc finger protein XlCGF57.1-like [Nematolebias whitei]
MSLKDKLQHNKTQDAVFNPEVLLHRSDIQQMVLIKEEAPEVRMLGVDQQDPETLNIKEEEEELWTSQEGEQFCVKKETDDSGFAFTAVPLKREEDEENPLFLQLHQHPVKEEDLPTSSSADQMKAATGGEDCGGAETTRNPDLNTYGDDCSSSETEVSEDDEGDDVNDSDSQLKDLLNSGSEPEDGDKDWKESRAPESCVNTVNKNCSFTEHGKQFHKTSQSVMSSSCLVVKECFEVKKTEGPVEKKQSRQNSFSCKDCGKRFNRKCNLNTHMIIHTGQKRFSCEDCGKRFNRKGNLKKHMIIHTGQKRFSCEDCGKRFNRKSNLKTHLIIHTGHKAFVCNLCGQRFGHKSTLKTHMIVHTGQKQFSCEDCGKRFNRKGDRNTHMMVHTGDKTFVCYLCGHKFGQKSHLNSHMIVHTGQKRFSCEDCGKRFNRKGNLNTHMIVHTGLKQFSCGACGKRFNRKGDLNTHMIVHTGQKSFVCDFCGQRFGRKSTLNRHMIVHTRGKQFSSE